MHTTPVIDTAHVAATAIARARDASGMTAAAFDYAIATNGIGGPVGQLGVEIYLLANAHMPEVIPGADNRLDERVANQRALWEALQDELQAYETRCKERGYVGWSTASRGPIRYAS